MRPFKALFIVLGVGFLISGFILGMWLEFAKDVWRRVK